MADNTLVLNSGGRFDPSMEQQELWLKVTVAYPGSKVSDLYIGDHKVQVPNAEIIKAHQGPKLALARPDEMKYCDVG